MRSFFRFRCQNNTQKSAVALYILVFNSVYKGEKIGCGHAVSTKTGSCRKFKGKKTNPSDNADAYPGDSVHCCANLIFNYEHSAELQLVFKNENNEKLGLIKPDYTFAIISTSTRAFFGRSPTPTQERAGFDEKYSP